MIITFSPKLSVFNYNNTFYILYVNNCFIFKGRSKLASVPTGAAIAAPAAAGAAAPAAEEKGGFLT